MTKFVTELTVEVYNLDWKLGVETTIKAWSQYDWKNVKKDFFIDFWWFHKKTSEKLGETEKK